MILSLLSTRPVQVIIGAVALVVVLWLLGADTWLRRGGLSGGRDVIVAEQEQVIKNLKAENDKATEDLAELKRQAEGFKREALKYKSQSVINGAEASKWRGRYQEAASRRAAQIRATSDVAAIQELVRMGKAR